MGKRNKKTLQKGNTIQKNTMLEILLEEFSVIFIVFCFTYIIFSLPYQNLEYDNNLPICLSLFRKYYSFLLRIPLYSESEMDYCREFVSESFNNNVEFLKNNTKNILTLPFMEYGVQICVKYNFLRTFDAYLC